ncbi:hypothetical protein NECAME_02833 [Necator americanus]|uniref:Uncharacterized protein n=1 Tax=Necator americanus TaxID=51031 RepID=W2TBW5_NECAM|nr:hypothetical protein NECAME_02833 [Necator americanus]ETN78686.1 hypothetical protein NECAME_02833 [Necator americanus]
MLTKIFIILAFHGIMDTALVFRRVCSYCRDKEVFEHGHNYVGFYQKQNTGPLEKFPCAKDPGKLMKCSTSCLQAQFIQQDTGKTYTYRDCGTLLLQEFGYEKINFSSTQYAMILTDVDDADPSDYNINNEETPKGKAVVDVKPTEIQCPEAIIPSFILVIVGILGVIAGVGLMIRVLVKCSRDRRIPERVSTRVDMNTEEILFSRSNP